MTHSVYVPEPSGVAPPPMRLLDRLVHALLPATCLGCGQPLPLRGTTLGLCMPCRGLLSRLPAQSCAVCALPLSQSYALPAGYRCGACRQAPPAFDRMLALWSYGPPLDLVLQALKFRRLDYLGRHLAVALAAELGPRLEDLSPIDCVVPVPLHWRRRLSRGYNQAERIARPLAGLLGLRFSPVLRRSRATPPQSLLGRSHRLANLRRAFRVPRSQAIRGLHVLLIDDVATTGATLDAAAKALKNAGAAAVTALVASRTPRSPKA